MKKLFKWPGGKTKELKIIEKLMPNEFDTLIEPFAGSAALSFHLERKCWVNDRYDLITNLYTVVANPMAYTKLLEMFENAKKMSVDEIKELFYMSRDYLNQDEDHDPIMKAFCFVVERQLALTGMLRYNKKGHFNASFGVGYYSKFTHNLTSQHHMFVSRHMKITNEDFSDCIKKAKKDDFVFVDPPYLHRNGYRDTFTLDDHVRLFEALDQCKAKWLLVHVDCPTYRELYANYNIIDKPFKYSQQWGDMKTKDADVSHLYIRNYE